MIPLKVHDKYSNISLIDKEISTKNNILNRI